MPGGSPLSDVHSVRAQLSRHLVGNGVELGPGHNPFPVPYTATRVSYVDRWRPEENSDRFPELAGAAFPVPDIVCNLDMDRLKPIDDASQDFVIASHILEHVVDPIGIVHEMHRVVRPGGTVLILLPDRRRTFDRRREPTQLSHLVTHYERGDTEVDDAHIDDWYRNVHDDEVVAEWDAMGPDERQKQLEYHRERSVHAHCWQEDEFTPVLLYGIGSLGHEWELVDAVVADDEGPAGIEFGYVLRRDDAPGRLSPAERRQRFDECWNAWINERRTTLAQVQAFHAAATAAESRTWMMAVKDVARPILGPVVRPLRDAFRRGGGTPQPT
jgi:SAM-dependent methyltransferase